MMTEPSSARSRPLGWYNDPLPPICQPTSKEHCMSVTESAILAALKEIRDPDRGQDIVSLGMVTGVQQREGHVAFAIEVERARAAKLEPLRKAAEKAVEA